MANPDPLRFIWCPFLVQDPIPGTKTHPMLLFLSVSLGYGTSLSLLGFR